MLRNSLPTIITDKVPGPNACVLLKKRDNALPIRQKNIFTAFSMWWHTVVTLNLLIGSTNLCHAKVIN